MNVLDVDVLIIGAGVMGLAVAARLPRQLNACVVERHEQFGRETSSRNSEVVHSGIYYPKDSLKTVACLRGRELLYDYANRRGIPFRRCGKIVVAVDVAQGAYLEKLAAHARDLGVPCEELDGAEIARREPLVRAVKGVFFPETGIVDSHQLMGALERESEDHGTAVAYRHRVLAVGQDGDRWAVTLETPEGRLEARAARVVNTAGLMAASLSNRALGVRCYEHRLCRGRYLMLPPSFRNGFRHLVYPVPEKDGLGVHVTSDLQGFARLGPDVEWCDGAPAEKADTLYDCDWDSLKEPFARAAAKYLPSVKADTLTPGLVGIRPKLFVDGTPKPDFLVEEAAPGWIHALGIESPGLTSALALSEDIAALIS